MFNDATTLKNNAHLDLNDENKTSDRFIPVNQLPQIDSHLTAKLYVDNAIDQPSLVRNNQNNDFNNYKSTNINSITLNKQAGNDNEVVTKAYVDEFHQENERSRRDLGTNFYDESNELVKKNQDRDLNDKKLTILNSIKVNRNPTSDNEITNKKYVDDELDKNTVIRFNQTLENYLKVSVGNVIYNLTKYKNLSITDITESKLPKTGTELLQKWNIHCNNKVNQSRLIDFIRSTKTNSPTGSSGATSQPPIGNSFKYIETSGINFGNDKIFVGWEKTDITQITNITNYYKRFSILTHPHLEIMGRLRIQLLPSDDNWSTVYTIAKNNQFDDNPTDWTLLNLDFTQDNYGIKLFYDQIDSAHADMFFSNITITHSVY